MQDRFKFRFFDKDKKIMIKPPDEMSDSEWRRCCNVYGYDEWYFSIELALTKVLDYFDDTSFELMQCTGLKDKNGKLIYEGDILKFKFGNEYRNGKVEYSQTIWSVSNAEFINRDYVGGALINLHKDCEVIGNIYENPELLKDGK